MTSCNDVMIFFKLWQLLRQKAPWMRIFCKKPSRYVNIQRLILQKIETEYNYLYYFFQEQVFKNFVVFLKNIFFNDVIKKWQPFWKKIPLLCSFYEKKHVCQFSWPQHLYFWRFWGGGLIQSPPRSWGAPPDPGPYRVKMTAREKPFNKMKEKKRG